jgi:hypothetical protein
MLRPPKKKSGPPKKTCWSFNVRIHYNSIHKKYNSVSRCNSEHILLIFEKEIIQNCYFYCKYCNFYHLFKHWRPPCQPAASPQGTRPPGWEPLHYGIEQTLIFQTMFAFKNIKVISQKKPLENETDLFSNKVNIFECGSTYFLSE